MATGAFPANTSLGREDSMGQGASQWTSQRSKQCSGREYGYWGTNYACMQS